MTYRPQNTSFVFSLAASLGFICGAGGVLFLAGPAAADVKAGVDAWSAGDYNAAVEEWRVPAENGDADALFHLAQAYRLGRGVEADIGRARDLYASAASKGHIKAQDNYGLLLFQQGEQTQAMPLIREAAERGDPRAQYVLGLSHFNADYAEKDWVRAYAMLTLSQSAGLPQATNALAQMDKYVPLAQRKEAQAMASSIEEEAARRRATQLVAADLSKEDARPQKAITNTTNSHQTQNAAQMTQTAPKPVRAAQLSEQPNPPSVQKPTRPVPEPAAQKSNGDWRVQLGAFGVEGSAEKLWNQLEANPALQGTDMALVSAGRVTKLQAVGFASRSDAANACSTLQAQGQVCIVARP